VLSIRVLGPVEVTAGDARVDLGGSLPRRLFAALVAAGGQVVTDDRLADLVWDGQPPVKMAAALQVHVSRLRGALGQGARELLERDNVGYRLRLDPEAVDATWFANAIETGRRQLTEGNADQAIRTFTEALALWRGDPYADIAEWDEVSAARGRLAELREVALEESAAARLAGGDAAGAAADLEELTRATPLRERRWALLILALYRAGRQGDAFAALRRVRAVLADELGVDPGAELQDLERRVLAHDPNLDTPPRVGTVSKPLTSFLGREREIQELTAALAEHRLVSLIGPAGVGKTRLAVEHASTGWFARLADVSQTAELPSIVADAVGLMAVKDDPGAAVIRAIGDRPGLLVLDNCEHVVDAAAEFVVALVARCPRLRILTTSREPLGVDGEVTIPVEPLPLETADALLVDRVRAIRPGWTPSSEELAQARRISAALDGLPLAIELAAARARVFGLEEIAARLDDRFALLGPVARGSLTPHATLEAAISWSVDLLAPADRALLLRLWPFEGGFTLEAAEAVLSGHQTLESLSALVIRSVVVADTTVMPTRYLMLESVRAYCRSIDPDPRATREAHAQWVRGMADGCVSAMRSKRSGHYLRLLRRELPNIRVGLVHDLDTNPLLAVRSVGQLSLFFTRCVHNTEALRFARAAVDVFDDAPAIDRARAMTTLIALLDFQGDFDEARRLVAEAAAGPFAELKSSDPLDDAEMHYFLGFAAVETQHVDIALDQAARAIAIGEDTGARWVAGAGRIVRSVALSLQACLEGDLDTMVASAQDAHRLARGWTGGWANAVLAEAYLRHPTGPAAEALTAVRKAVAVFRDQEDIPFALNTVALGALALYKLGRAEDALKVIGAVHAHADRLGFRVATFLSPDATWIDEALPEYAVSDLYGPSGDFPYDLLHETRPG
jgi:predicted ATPase/DNA-binding SARP family transcriptional activator